MKKIIEGLTSKEKILLTLLLSLIITLIVYNKVLLKKRIKSNLIKEDIVSLERKISRINSFKTGEYNIDYEEILELDYKNLNLEKLFKLINLSENKFFTVKSLEIKDDGSLEDNNNINKNIIYIEACGEIDKILAFIYDVENTLELIELGSISVNNSGEELGLEMAIYLYEINHEFKYLDKENKNTNKDPFGKVDQKLENIIKVDKNISTEELDQVEENGGSMVLKEFEDYGKKESRESIDFEYLDLDKGISYSSVINSVESKNKKINIELFDREILNENVLEFKYDIKKKEKFNLVIINMERDEIKIDGNSKISFMSEIDNDVKVDVILTNGKVSKKYPYEGKLTKNWIGYGFELEEAGYYLSQILLDLSDSKNSGVINVKIK